MSCGCTNIYSNSNCVTSVAETCPPPPGIQLWVVLTIITIVLGLLTLIGPIITIIMCCKKK